MTAPIIEDQTLRDGLQAESRIFSLEEKIHLFEGIAEAGVRRIQVGSFVHPKRVPQMANTDELIARLKPGAEDKGLLLTGLVLNDKGLDRALAAGLGHASLSVSASDTHSRKNANQPADEALELMAGLIRRAASTGMAVRAGVQCAFGCVYEGPVPQERVLGFARDLTEAGASEVCLADTTGMADPVSVRRLTARVREEIPGMRIVLHLHDTRGLGLANTLAGWESGAEIFDTACGGLGGCPFVKGAAGNTPTEDVVHLFEAVGADTGLDWPALCRVTRRLEEILGRSLPGRMLRVLESRARERRS